MPRYLVQASYNTQGIANLVKNPQDRAAAVRPLVERLGGKLESLDFAFGEFDVVAIVELPDNVSMAALSMALGASGWGQAKTTVLIPMREAVEAMRKAGTVGYRPPAG